MNIDTMNKYIVGASAKGITIMNPPKGPMTQEEALVLAAYLVSMADLGEEPTFEQCLKAVQGE